VFSVISVISVAMSFVVGLVESGMSDQKLQIDIVSDVV